MEIGAVLKDNGVCDFILYSPLSLYAELEIFTPEKKTYDMKKNHSGYFTVSAENIEEGTVYMFKTDKSGSITDPASRKLEGGVHGMSVVVDYRKLEKKPSQNPKVDITEYVIYELHTGTFSDDGDFDGVKSKIPYLKELGITAVEIMPVSEFPGKRNWGYDGVYPYCVYSGYGGVFKLRELIDEFHRNGIAVIIDVVYNHLGPEGNYLWSHGVYFTNRYKTPWGEAINYDGEHSDGVRNYFIENALYWFKYLDADCLRLDAVHAVIDLSPSHIIRDIKKAASELSISKGKPFFIIAESDLNDFKVLKEYGMNCDCQWCDDFHHSLHTLLTGEQSGFYKDFGSIENMADAFSNGYVYDGKYSKNRLKTFGSGSNSLISKNLVVFSQNHDMTGNRALGERLASLVNFNKLKLAAAAVILSPFIPMIFAGEEYGEKNPFLYFIDHTDRNLVEMVRKGRKEEFSEFMRISNIPEPDLEETFNKSKLSFSFNDEKSCELFELYKSLIKLRKTIGLNKNISFGKINSYIHNNKILTVKYSIEGSVYCLVLNFSENNENYIKPFSGDFSVVFSTGKFEFNDGGAVIENSAAVVLSVK